MSGNGTGARLRNALPLVPFLLYLFIFLMIPTITVVVKAFENNGHLSLVRLRTLGNDAAVRTLWHSVLVSGVTAVAGALLGALLAYLVVTSPPTSLFRRMVTSVCSVLASSAGSPWPSPSWRPWDSPAC